MRLPIFQLTWELASKNVGLVFTSEAEANIQSFFFALPIRVDYSSEVQIYRQAREQLDKNSYFFPAEIGGEYVQIEGFYKYPEFHFKVNDFAPFKFFVDPFPRLPNDKNAFLLDKYIYRGKYSGLSDFLFIPLTPSDMSLLNAFFWERRGIFVGFTPVFDESGFMQTILNE
jgi:hypothetical protein